MIEQRRVLIGHAEQAILRTQVHAPCRVAIHDVIELDGAA